MREYHTNTALSPSKVDALASGIRVDGDLSADSLFTSSAEAARFVAPGVGLTGAAPYVPLPSR
jgi:hypothetical protein